VSEVVLFASTGREPRGDTYNETAENAGGIVPAKKYRTLRLKVY
jgi:hypothetical protein